MKHKTEKYWQPPYARSQPDWNDHDKPGGCRSAASVVILFLLSAAVLAQAAHLFV